MTAAANTRLVIADDHPLFRDALRQAVASVVTSAKVDEAGSFDELTTLLEQDSDVDLILLDLTMPGVRGFSGLMYLRAQYPSVPIVVVSANDDPSVIRRCMDFGASGFMPKTLGIEQMRDAIKRVLGGGVWTPPEFRGRGYARSVVAGSLVAAGKQGVARAVLFADPLNAAARAAYLSIGFAIVGDYGLVLFAP